MTAKMRRRALFLAATMTLAPVFVLGGQQRAAVAAPAQAATLPMDQARTDYRAAKAALAGGNKQEVLGALNKLESDLPSLQMPNTDAAAMLTAITRSKSLTNAGDMRGAEKALDEGLARIESGGATGGEGR